MTEELSLLTPLGCDTSVSYTHLDVYKRQIRGSQQLGLKKNTYATVLATDPANNLVTVARADGQHVAYDPQRLRGVNVYTNLPCEFSTGCLLYTSRCV